MRITKMADKKDDTGQQVEGKTFESFDQLGWDGFANQLTSFIQTEADFVDGSLVISLNAGFGEGKSTFFEMWESQLKSDVGLPDAIRLNAWESDFINDPLLAIVFSVVQHLEEKPEQKEVVQKIKKGAGKLVRVGASLGNGVIAHLLGADLIKAAQVAEKGDLVEAADIGESIYDDFKARTKALKDVRDGFKEAFSEEEASSLIVIVDELDRCRPDYAISYLETIKHIFDIPQLTFVLGVDKNALACVAKSLFGADLKFNEYYRKFVHRNISLPEPDENAVRKFCSKLITEYVDSEPLKGSGRYSYAKVGRHNIDRIRDLCVNFDLTPRQVHEMFRCLAHLHSCDEDHAGRLLWGWEVASLFMIATSLQEPDVFRKLGKGKISLDELGLFLQSKGFFKKKNRLSSWWFNVLFLAVSTEGNESIENLFEVYLDYGLINKLATEEETTKARESLKREISSFYEGFGYGLGYDDCALEKIYKLIEGVKRFTD